MSVGLDRFLELINSRCGELISVEELSKLTGLRAKYFYNLRNQENGLPSIKIGKRIRFYKADVIQWFKCSSTLKKENSHG
jgi:excisionase family DNA binding protein